MRAKARRRGLLVLVALALSSLWGVPASLAQAGTTITAVDNDPENKLWNCETNRVAFGNESSDTSRCFTFRFEVPPGGVTSATLHIAVKPLGGLQDTDAVVVAVGQPFERCAWAIGGMQGCVVVHGGFQGPETSVDLDLFNLTCDPSVQAGAEEQQAVIAQLQTGVVHVLLQDDTAVFGGRLVLNGAPLGIPCGASVRPTDETVPPGGGGSDDEIPPFGSDEPARVDGMALQAGQRRVAAGEVVNVPVWLINGADVANINFTAAYDPAVARPESELLKGSVLGNALFSSNAAEDGLIRAGFAGTSGINGTGTVAYLPFRAVGQPGTRTRLHLEVPTINNPGGTLLEIQRIDGLIEIVGADGLLPGDCDGDGRMTELDALCALQMSVQLIPSRATLDVDGTGDVTSRDSVVILQRAVGL